MIDRCFIYQKAHQGGIRHSKLPKFVPKVDPRLPSAYQPVSALLPPITNRIEDAARWLSRKFSGPVKGFQPKESLQFDNWMYRFWQPDWDDNKLCSFECRGCGSSFVQPEFLRTHIGTMGCSKVICAAYKLLLKDMKCVICDNTCRASQQKWGVPLCSSGCEEAWCVVEARPRALELAIQLAEKQGLV